MTESQQHQREMTSPLIILAFGVWCLAMAIGCASPSAPSPVVIAPVVAPVAAVPASPVLPPVTVAPPASATPEPVMSSRPFVRTDCDYSGLGAIRCYNPSATAITITAALNTLDCGTSFGAQTITIPPQTNGYFTLPSLACGQAGQIDFYWGSQQGSCRTPDFTSQRTYAGPACPLPSPPPPAPHCVKPGRVQTHPNQPPPSVCP